MSFLTLADLALLGAGAAPPVLWTPASMTTSLWLDGSDSSSVILNGSTISQWSDRSGNGRHATQSTASIQPVYSSGGVVFTSDRLTIPAAAYTATNGSIILVMQGSATGGSGTGLVNINTSPVDDPEIRLGVGASGTQLLDLYNGSYVINQTLAAVGSKCIVCIEHTTGGKAELFVNGSSVTSATVAGTLSTTSSFNLGYYPTTSAYRDGTIWHVITYLSSTSDRQKLEGWLAHGEGLTGLLPAGHPYKSAPPYV